MFKNTTFTAYMMKAFDECPKKFDYIYQQKIQLPTNVKNTEIGEKIHILANYYLNHIDTKNFEKSLSKEEKEIFENFKKNELLNSKLVASEYPFTVKIENYWLTGRIDAIFERDEKIIIADWKTGQKSEDENDYQSMIYLYALYVICSQKRTELKPENLEFHYFYLKNNERINIEYSMSKMLEQKEFLTNKIKQILSLPYFLPNRCKCYTCNFKRLCYNYSNKGMNLMSV